MGESVEYRGAFSSPLFCLKYLLTTLSKYLNIFLSKQTTDKVIKMTKREMLRNLIKATNGMFFSISFIKKSGEERTLTVRDGVESKLALPKGMGSNNQEHCPNLITLFDVQAGRYKSVNLDTVTSVRCGSKVMWEEK